MLKIDLHTHSIISHDGGIASDEYELLLNSGKLDCIAITDHNETRFARNMHKKLGDRIIVGEEISTKEGEIIGLFLKETIPGGGSIDEAIANIKLQGGIVYLPHPFETFRKGIQQEVVDRIKGDIAIVEVWNGRGRFRGKPKQAEQFAIKNDLPQAASSDAHHRRGLGHTYSLISEMPTRTSLEKLLRNGGLEKKYAPFYTFFYPAIYRIKNKIVLTGEQ